MYGQRGKTATLILLAGQLRGHLHNGNPMDPNERIDASEVAMWSGILMGAASFCAALSNPYWGAMADRKGRKPKVEKVLLLYGIIITSMAFVANVYQLLTLRVLQGLCGGFIAAGTALGGRLFERTAPDLLARIKAFPTS